MSKEEKAKKKSKHETRFQHFFIKKKIEQDEPVENDSIGIDIPINKKRKT